MVTEKLNRWLTLGANLGVLVGIILILLELSRPSSLMRAQLMQARANNILESYREQMYWERWVRIRAIQRNHTTIKERVDQHSPEEYERVMLYSLHELHFVRTQFEQHRDGLIDEEVWEYASNGQARRLVEVLPYMDFHATSDPNFQEFLNQMAKDPGLPPVSAER